MNKAELIDAIAETRDKKELKKTWTEEKKEKLKNTYLEVGKDLNKAAEVLGVTVQSARTILSRNYPDVYVSTAKAPKTKFWTEEKEQELENLYQEFGAESIEEIADKLGTTKLVVFKQLKKLGIDYKADLEALKED